MKYITLLLSLLLLSTCKTSSQTATSDFEPATETNTNIAQSNIVINYSAITRGSFLEIKLENQQILVKKDQYTPGKILELSDTEWHILLDQLHNTDLDALATLEPPSNKRAYDGAASAKLTILEDDLKYSAPEFDHGNPNAQIKPLVDYILSLAKKVE